MKAELSEPNSSRGKHYDVFTDTSKNITSYQMKKDGGSTNPGSNVEFAYMLEHGDSFNDLLDTDSINPFSNVCATPIETSLGIYRTI